MIEYRESAEGIGPEQLQGFFAGWPNPPSPTTHLRLLQGSDAVVLALEGERVVGFITALSDGVLTAFIPLLEVLPDHQGQGIGSELARRMLARLAHLYAIDLLCDEEVRPFYARLGMRPASGMALRNYANQAGLPRTLD